MIYKSASTRILDAYQAGSVIGESLKSAVPEVVLLFSSVSLECDYPVFFDGLTDGLDNRNVIVFGGTGDGVYESSLVSHYGICALGISSEGALKWSTAFESGVGADSFTAACRCAASARVKLEDEPDWAFILADGITADGSAIVSGVLEQFPFPFFGGLTGDDRKFARSRIFLNDTVLQDSVAILAASGGMPFLSHSSSGFVPMGTPGIVDKSHGRSIQQICGQTPHDFIKAQIGTPLAEADFGILALAAHIDQSQDHLLLRVLLDFDKETGEITNFGSTPSGATIRVCTANSEQLLQAVSEGITTLLNTGFVPTAAIVISCVGRKWQMGSCGEEEVRIIQKAIGQNIPLVGFPSFGEIGPFLDPEGTHTNSHFHNATCVICLLGA